MQGGDVFAIHVLIMGDQGHADPILSRSCWSSLAKHIVASRALTEPGAIQMPLCQMPSPLLCLQYLVGLPTCILNHQMDKVQLGDNSR